MFFRPAPGYIHIEPLKSEEVSGNFAWDKPSGDLTTVKVICGDGSCYFNDDVVVVISTMIQQFDYNKNKIKVCPTSAIIGKLEEIND